MFKMSAAWDIFKSERLINLHRHFAYECLDKQGDSQKSKRKKKVKYTNHLKQDVFQM